MGFKAKTTLEEHYIKEHPNNPKPKLETKPMKHGERFFCSVCPGIRGFTRKCALDLHIASGHAAKRVLYRKHGRDCKICGKWSLMKKLTDLT